MKAFLALAAFLVSAGAAAAQDTPAASAAVAVPATSSPTLPDRSNGAPSPLSEIRYAVRIEPGPGPAWWTVLVPIVGPLVSGLIAFEGVRRGLRINEVNTARTVENAFRTSEASNWQKANEAEFGELREKVEGFFGPYIQLSEFNLLLARDLKSRQSDPDDFRLLTALFDEGWRAGLSAGDAEIVHQIRDNGERLEGLIMDKAGLVDALVLPYLTRASAHFRIFRLAYDRELGTDPAPFERYVYPRALDAVLDLEERRLNTRMTALRAAPTKEPAPRSPPSGLPALEPWIAAPPPS